MKITEEQLKAILDGEKSLDELNKEIQLEVSKSFTKGQEKAAESGSNDDVEKLRAENKELKTSLEKYSNKETPAKNDGEETPKVDSKLMKELEALRLEVNTYKENYTKDSNERSINSFKSKYKGKITDEQIEVFVKTYDPEKLSELDVTPFLRKDIDDSGTGKASEPNASEMAKKRVRESLGLDKK